MRIMINLLAVALVLAAQAAVSAEQQPLVEFAGSQRNIFETGKADGVVPVAAMSGNQARYGVGAFEGLDGEITVFEGRPYVTRVRDNRVLMDSSGEGQAIFAVWTSNTDWRDVPIPESVQTYLDLQNFIAASASAAGLDTAEAFPFLLTGTAAQITWHINVDRSEGRPINNDIFAQSKDSFVMSGQPVDIVGFYSEQHPGVFISTYAPAITEAGTRNTIHIHVVSQDGLLAGHIDDLQLSGGMTLRLPHATE